MFIFIYLVFISILVPTINGIAASSFSREGKHFDFVKYIPLDYRSQILAKFLASFIISFIGINVFTIIFFIVIKISLKYFLLYFLLSILCVMFVSSLGVVIDSIYPRLTWDDEIDILRENTNNFLVMGLTTFFTFLLCGVGYYCFKKGTSFDLILLISILSLFIINTITTLLLVYKVPKNIESMEDL
jgi:ABC-2 type transport system permease protein